MVLVRHKKAIRKIFESRWMRQTLETVAV